MINCLSFFFILTLNLTASKRNICEEILTLLDATLITQPQQILTLDTQRVYHRILQRGDCQAALHSPHDTHAFSEEKSPDAIVFSLGALQMHKNMIQNLSTCMLRSTTEQPYAPLLERHMRSTIYYLQYLYALLYEDGPPVCLPPACSNSLLTTQLLRNKNRLLACTQETSLAISLKKIFADLECGQERIWGSIQKAYIITFYATESQQAPAHHLPAQKPIPLAPYQLTILLNTQEEHLHALKASNPQ